MKLHEVLHWIFAALFLVLGMGMFFIDDREQGRRWAGVVAICLGGFALSLMWNALVTGEIKLKDFHYHRTSEPRRFAATIAMLAASGTVVVVFGSLAAMGLMPD